MAGGGARLQRLRGLPAADRPQDPTGDPRAPLEPAHRLVRRALARAHGAVHVAAPEDRRLGPGPVDAAHRLPQRRAELRERARAGVGQWTAPGPLLLPPVALQVPGRLESLGAEELGAPLERHGAAFAGGPAGGRPRP